MYSEYINRDNFDFLNIIVEVRMEYRGFMIFDESYKTLIDERIIDLPTGDMTRRDSTFLNDIELLIKIKHCDPHDTESYIKDFDSLLNNQVTLLNSLHCKAAKAAIVSNVIFPTLSELKSHVCVMCDRDSTWRNLYFSKLVYFATIEGLESAVYLMYDIFPEFMNEDCHLILKCRNRTPIYKTSHPIYDWHKNHLVHACKN